MNKALKITLKSLLVAVIALLLAAIIYVAYVFLSYSRLPDNIKLNPESKAANERVETGKSYTIVTQNMGFGAYSQDYTFFMDGGKESRARSKAATIGNINSLAQTVTSFLPDFALFQEVDTDSTRSYHVDETQLVKSQFSNYTSVYAENYHSAYLMYPIFKPHGASNSGMLTFSGYKINSSVRRSLPISTSVSKILDLDRCYSKSRISVNNGKEMILYNVHTSAYGGSDKIRKAQMTMLFNDMEEEYKKGNYCVCGGDFNHDFTGDSAEKLNGKKDDKYGWAQPFPKDLLPDCIKQCTDYDGGKLIPSCRNCDIPYKKGNYTIIVDGFLVSENVKVDYVQTHNVEFLYSDHNPVVMKFTLK